MCDLNQADNLCFLLTPLRGANTAVRFTSIAVITLSCREQRGGERSRHSRLFDIHGKSYRVI
jgi:hypothetical protein